MPSPTPDFRVAIIGTGGIAHAQAQALAELPEPEPAPSPPDSSHPEPGC